MYFVLDLLWIYFLYQGFFVVFHCSSAYYLGRAGASHTALRYSGSSVTTKTKKKDSNTKWGFGGSLSLRRVRLFSIWAADQF